MRMLLGGWVIVIALVLFFIVLKEIPHQVEHTTIDCGPRPPLRVVLYHPPASAVQRRPATVICQPLNNPPESSRALALELVKAGVVLTFDWRGQSPEQNRQLRGSWKAARRISPPPWPISEGSPV